MQPARRIDLDALPYGLGAIALGAVSLAVGDFALQWQPVPAGIPARGLLASLSGAVLILGGIAALWNGAGRARLILPVFYLLWVLALHVPVVAAAPNVGSLLGLAELLALAAGGTALVAAQPSAQRFATVARVVFGLCALVFGLSHIVYADFTAAMVPAWMPWRLFWAYATGAAHIAAGLAIASGVLARLAASLLAAMCGLFVLLLHVPRVAAAPGDRLEWTMLSVAVSITGAAWLIRRWLRP